MTKLKKILKKQYKIEDATDRSIVFAAILRIQVQIDYRNHNFFIHRIGNPYIYL